MYVQKARAALDPFVRRLSDIGANLPARPWVSIWTRPRATMRTILETHHGRLVLPLAMLGGFAAVLNNASFRNMGDSSSVPHIFLVSAMAGPVAGLIGLYIGGVLLAWTGRWLNGQATGRDVRAVLAWSNIPLIWGLLLWIPELMLFGKEMFTRETPRLDASLFLAITFLGFTAVGFVLTVWTIIIFIQCLAEAQRFSIGKTLGNIVVAVLAVLIPIGVIAAIIDGIFR